LVTNLK